MGIREDWQPWSCLGGEVSIGLPTLVAPFLRKSQPHYSRTGVTGA